MNRRNFIATTLGALTASTVKLPALAVAADPLEGMSLLAVTNVRGYFQNGAFVRVFERILVKDDCGKLSCVVNPDYFDAPLEMEIWGKEDKAAASVVRERGPENPPLKIEMLPTFI